MSIIQGNAHTSAGGGYQIERSLRFNSADSAYLNRTPASAGNRKTWTWSGWVKLTVTSDARLFAARVDNNNRFIIAYAFSQSDFQVTNVASGTSTVWTKTNALLRDPSAWYHFVVAFDSTQATATNRLKVYINGVEQTFSTDNRSSITQNYDGYVNNNIEHYIGSATGSNYADCYLTEVNFIDGQALTPSSFGETDSNTGVWSPKRYTGTYGTNGFYLNFSDNSGTTSTTLGKDSSGNGNNWTPNNFSVTAGAGNDSLVDSPTSYGTDTGVGGEVRGNYCTWNPLAKSLLTGTFTFSNGNLDVSDAASSYGAVLATLGASSGKWYWEVTCVSSGGSSGYIGIVPSSATDPTVFGYPGAGGSYSYSTNGQKFTSNSGTTYGATYTTGDIIGVALDLDVGTLVFYKNGSSQGTAFSSLSGSFVPSVGDGAGATQYSWTANFGQRAFAYTAPSGFKALCTQNLPTPTIGATSTTRANKYIDVITRNGLAPSGSFSTSIQLATDGGLIWQKVRNAADNHYLIDTVRGISKTLFSNSTNAEGTDANFITAVANGSVTMGSNDWISSQTVVGWLWGAGGTGVSNTAGTITSTVSANTTSGFSIVTYTGTGANATVGHGLGVAPSFIITKHRNAADGWYCYHASLGNNAYIQLSSTAARVTPASTYWQTTTPSSTVFSIGTSNSVNQNTINFVAYCFAPVAGYSAFGSYTGNGSADGPFVFTNFRPAFVMAKRTDSTENWLITDSARNTSNVVTNRLYANLSAAEDTGTPVDFLSNGFKIRAGAATPNISGGTYIYMAFAETPAKFSLAR